MKTIKRTNTINDQQVKQYKRASRQMRDLKKGKRQQWVELS